VEEQLLQYRIGVGEVAGECTGPATVWIVISDPIPQTHSGKA
jgi:hypothetical protein